MDFFNDQARILIELGYNVIPIPKGSKAPNIKGWSKLKLTVADVEANKGLNLNYGVGVLTGGVIAIDIDVYEKKIVEKLTAYCFENMGNAPTRVGEPPKTLLVYRSDDIKRKLSSKGYTDVVDKVNKIEVLSAGNNFVAYGIHPNTHLPYVWAPSQGLMNLPFDKLTNITLDQIQKLFSYFESIVEPDWEVSGSNKLPDTAKYFPISRTGNSIRKIEDQLGKLQENSSLISLARKCNLYHTEWIDVLACLDAGDYNTWYLAGMALHYEYDGNTVGFKLWYDWSLQSPKSDAVLDFTTKWQSFKYDPTNREGSGPRTGKHLLLAAEEHGYIRTPQNQLPVVSVVTEDLAAFLDRFVFIKAANSVFDLQRPPHVGLFKDMNTFHNQFRSMKHCIPAKNGSVKRVALTSFWLEHEDRKNGEGLLYSPSDAAICKDDYGYMWVNSFYMPHRGDRPDRVDVSVFTDHLAYLLPVEEERLWMLQWMAHLVQQPHVRPKVTPFHISKLEGTGRGWLTELLFKLLGRWNCSTTNIAALCKDSSESGFTDYIDDKLLCVIEEVKEDNKRYSISYKTRSILTDIYQNVNVKYGGKMTKPVFTRFFLQSNHDDALVLSSRDRRFNVFSGPGRFKDNNYYMRLYAWLTDTNMRHLYHFLSDIDLRSWNFQRAFVTKAKMQLIDASTSMLDEIISDYVRDTPHRVLTFRQILKDIEDLVYRSQDYVDAINDNRIRVILGKYATCGAQVRIGGSRVRPWFLKQQTEAEASADLAAFKTKLLSEN